MRSKRSLWTVVIGCLVTLTLAIPVGAITHGEFDGDGHPNVGSIVLVFEEGGEVVGLFQWCSGTLIAEDVYLTASHCTADLDFFVEFFEASHWAVSFDPILTATSTLFTGVAHTNPNYNGFQGKGGASDPGDIAVIVLDDSPGITPAALPEAGLLDDLKEDGILKDTRFTAVGYGTVRESHQTGFQGILDNAQRNRAEQGFLSLTKAWITMSMNPNTGNAGTCYGDSGGPHFIHEGDVETDIVVSITVTGDAVCKATDKTYRVDTQSSLDFLEGFING